MSNPIGKLRRQLLSPHADDRRIAIGFLYVSLFVLVGKFAGAAKEMAIAWRYGVSAVVDAYVLVFSIVTWPVALWLNVLSIALVPVLVRTANEDPADLARFRGELLAWNLLLAAVLAGLAWQLLPALVDAGWFAISDRVRPLAVAAAKTLALAVPFGLLASYFATLLMAQGRYRNTLLEAMPSVAILAALMAPAGWVPAPLLWGTVAGFLVQAALLAHLSRAHTDLALVRPGFRAAAWQGVGGSVVVLIAGQAIASLNTIVDQALAARVGEGAASSLAYAGRVMALVLGMGAVGLGRATLHVFAEVHQQRRDALFRLALKWSALACGAGIVAAILLWAAAPLAVGLLFERGAFTAADTAAVTHLLRIYTAQLPFYFATTVLMNYLASAGLHRNIALAAALALVGKLAFLALPLPWPRVDMLAASSAVFTLIWLAAELVPAIRLGRRAVDNRGVDGEKGTR